ncbi:MAG: dihydroxyacetone kinase subunit L [Rhodospirillales bacterium]|nr:dihydroxyacetone kinase subunit L [Rhodospirillales bacterium]
MASKLLQTLIDRAGASMRDHAEELTKLDSAIGDGDHGVNMARGFDAITEQRDDLAALPVGQALQKAGMTLVMKVGGASGPLYGSLLMATGKAWKQDATTCADVAAALEEGIQAVMKRGKSQAGEKTMLDVLVPVNQALADADGGFDGPVAETLRTTADQALASTKPMFATKGRASFLGERSIGHLDPGARSSALLVHAVLDALEDCS